MAIVHHWSAGVMCSISMPLKSSNSAASLFTKGVTLVTFAAAQSLTFQQSYMEPPRAPAERQNNESVIFINVCVHNVTLFALKSREKTSHAFTLLFY